MKEEPSSEIARQHALARYALTEGAHNKTLERIAGLAAQLLDVPAAQINLISEEAQHTIADVNWPGQDVPRAMAFCNHTIALDPDEDILEVTDARLDKRFEHNPFVTGAASLRYYAAAPLRTPDGYAIGTLCVLGTRPRPPLAPAQRAILTQFAELVMNEFERHRAVRELRTVFEAQHTQEARLKALLEGTSDLVLFKDRDGRYLDVNPAAEALLGPARDVLGRTDLELFGLDVYARSRAMEAQVMHTREHLHYEQHVQINGQTRLFHSTKFPLLLGNGEAQGVIVVRRDLTEREALERALREANEDLERRVRDRTRALEDAVYRDALTGLSNRHAFDLALDTALSRANRAQDSLHLLIIDLDELKRINDEFGHARGDEFLKAFASALQRVFTHNAAFRFGGDEFALLLEGELSHPIPDLVRQAVQLTREAGFPLASASVGAARYPQDAQAASDLLRLADQRMLREKTAGRSVRHMKTTPDSPPALETPGAALQAIRATLNLLTHERELDAVAWKGLLEAAVASVPGADAGSLTLREGNEFVYRAQVGFSDALLGMRQSLPEARTWHGQAGWSEGRARIIRGKNAVLEHSKDVVSNPERRRLYEEFGALRFLKANISVPVVLGGEVVAEINLDNLRQEAAFDNSATQLAEEFATQAAALLAAAQRRAAEEARRRELEVLVRTSNALREALNLEDIEVTLCLEAASLLGSEDVVYLRHHADEDVLELTARGWPYQSAPRRMTRSQGAVWDALHNHRQIQTGDSELAELLDMVDPALLITPLQKGAGVIGVLVAARPSGHTFTRLEAQLVAAVASSGVTAVQRLQAERNNAERLEELRLLADLGRLASLVHDPAEVAQRCLSACRDFLKADYAGYFHAGDRVLVNDGSAPPEFFASVEALAQEHTLVSHLLTPDAPVIATSSYPLSPFTAPSLVSAGVQGLVFVPVMAHGSRVGFVGFVWFRALRRLPSVAESLASRVAELVGRTLEQHAYIQDLKGTHEGALLALGLSLELRDFETHGHTERVVTLSAALGHQLGLSSDELEGLRQGAYLHDVGKLAIPDAVLLKPGKLDPDEWHLMQTHAVLGAEMIARIPTVHPDAHSVICYHHERWDGRGYPHGLAGEAIPLPARIFSLVDVFDALTSERPYKRAWTVSEAITEIHIQAGAQFDPVLTEVFLSLLEQQP